MSSISPSSSLTSVEDVDAAPRRHLSKKRFSNVQTMMLENMYKHNSRPSRQERETLSKAGQIDMKTVTIWFQNKRQSERKVARAVNEGRHHQQRERERGGGHKRKRSSLGAHSSSASLSSSVSPRLVPLPAGNSSPLTPSSSFPPSARPSLERVASRSELAQPVPQTPRKSERDPRIPIWDCMPSSPPHPVDSPPARDFVEFGKFRRTITLEWACARRRLAEKEGGAVNVDEEEEEDDEVDRIMLEKAMEKAGKAMHTHRLQKQHGGGSIPAHTRKRLERSATWDTGDARKSVTPSNTTASMIPSGLRRSDSYSYHHPMTAHTNTNTTPEDDDDVMRAALALCGLGRGRDKVAA
ncbi:hypothetical protein V5O48_011689 [Marasmius crinis-equi]|uniref:Homeobox domain-containing protein n=1 Tax=Marasmius crinis-equi TaxID=585013 RepID=A0ABR3F4W7_9AGAR